MSFSSFAAPLTAKGEPAATDKRGDIEDIAMRWQSHSSRGAAAGVPKRSHAPAAAGCSSACSGTAVAV